MERLCYRVAIFPTLASFNSLQTGKFMERQIPKGAVYVGRPTFQFPSNGKVHGKAGTSYEPSAPATLGFNSLQMGKFMEREVKGHLQSPHFLFQFPSNGKVHGNKLRLSVEAPDDRFNSLQTGKFMERHVFSSQSPQDSAHLKTVRDPHRAFFTYTLTPKLLQTLMDTDSRAILRPEWRRTLSMSMLFDNFR